MPVKVFPTLNVEALFFIVSILSISSHSRIHYQKVQYAQVHKPYSPIYTLLLIKILWQSYMPMLLTSQFRIQKRRGMLLGGSSYTPTGHSVISYSQHFFVIEAYMGET